MKRKSFIFSMGVAALLFAACSNDDNLMGGPTGNGPEQAVVEGEPTYASFTVKGLAGSGNTRATEAPEGEGDNTIGTVTLLIFNNQTKVLENKFTITSTSSTATGTYLITSGKKRIFAFSNLGAKSGQTAVDGLQPKSSTVDDMLALTTQMGTDLGQTTTVVPMSTPDTGVATDVKNGIEETDAPTTNHFNFAMSRMIAKAKLVLKSTVGDKLKSTSFIANNIAKSSYLVQHAVGGVVKSPLYEKAWGTNPDTDITAADFMAREKFPATQQDVAANSLDKFYYLSENTSPSFLKGAATHFILKGTFIPDVIFTGATFNVATQNIDLTPNNNPTEGDCKGYCYVTESPNTAVIPVGVFFKSKAILTAVVTTYNAGIKEANKQINASDVKFLEYGDGSYYRINLGEGTNAENTRFGVERNTAYTVTVNSVTGPGFTKPDGNDGAEGLPTDPIDQKTYVNVSITASPWKSAEQSSDIN